MSKRKIIAFDTEGNPPGNFEDRLRNLLQSFDLEYFQFNTKSKLQSGWKLFNLIRKVRPDLIVMEGTGSIGGAVLLLSRWFLGIPYVFSSGDAVGPFLSMKFPLLTPVFFFYEALLYYFSRGFIGWTPYLSGRALTLGAPRAVVAAGWSPFQFQGDRKDAGAEVRSQYGISEDVLVVGIVGSLQWNSRAEYCYGLEIVRALKKLQRKDLIALIVGGGPGLEHLKAEAGELLGKSIFLVGPKPRSELLAHLCAMDIGSLPQSVDGVGSFRYTTKISEYIEAQLPIVTGQIPLAYDFGNEPLWRLPGYAPWDSNYTQAFTELLERITPEEIQTKRSALKRLSPIFEKKSQQARVSEFIEDCLNDSSLSRS